MSTVLIMITLHFTFLINPFLNLGRKLEEEKLVIDNEEDDASAEQEKQLESE